jgi:UDP:flavonoid glycosyltransferase YjiC (YdhE family)
MLTDDALHARLAAISTRVHRAPGTTKAATLIERLAR